MRKAIFLVVVLCVLSVSACASSSEDVKFTEENRDAEKESAVLMESEETEYRQMQWQVYIFPDMPEPFIEVLKQYEEFMNAENQNLNDESVQNKLEGGEWCYLYSELCGIWMSRVERDRAEIGGDAICYSLTDLTGDGFPELIMGYDGETPYVIYYYSEKDGIKMEYASSYFTMELYGGGIVKYLSGGVEYTMTYLQFQEEAEEWLVKDRIGVTWDSDDRETSGYCRIKYMEDAVIEEPISSEEYLQMEEQYTAESIELEWIPLV